MAIEAIIRQLLRGIRPEPGARSSISALELADYDALFRGRRIFTGFRRDEAGEFCCLACRGFELPFVWAVLGGPLH